MSWLSKGLKSAGKGLKKLGKNAGKVWEKVDDYVLPAAGFMLAGPAGAGLGSAAARGIGDGKFDAGATLGAGIKGYGMGQMASMAGLQGGQGFDLLGGGGGGAAAAGGAAPSMASAGAPGAAPAASGGFSAGGALRSAGNFLKDNPELVLGGFQAYQGAKQAGQANKLDERALALAEQPWNETAGLRKHSLEALMNQDRPDLSGIYGGSSNPFSRPLRSVRGGR
jgi:hypothetical protein